MKKEFVITDAQHCALMEACKPVPYLTAGGMEPRSQQERANDAWKELGRELGFDWRTVTRGSSDREFYAEQTPKAPDHER